MFLHRLLDSLLFIAGLVMVLGGVGYIEQAPLTLAHTLAGAGIALIGVVLWIVALLHIHYMGVSNGHR